MKPKIQLSLNQGFTGYLTTLESLKTGKKPVIRIALEKSVKKSLWLSEIPLKKNRPIIFFIIYQKITPPS